MPPGIVDVFKVIDINQQYRGGDVAASALLKFISQQHFPVPAIKDPGHSVAGAHHFQPPLMLSKPDGCSVAEPGKEHGIKHEYGKREAPLHRIGVEDSPPPEEWQRHQRREQGQHYPRDKQTAAAGTHHIHPHHHHQRCGRKRIHPHHADPEPGNNGIDLKIEDFLLMRGRGAAG